MRVKTKNCLLISNKRKLSAEPPEPFSSERLDELRAVVECVEALSSVRLLVEFLDADAVGAEFLVAALRFVVVRYSDPLSGVVVATQRRIGALSAALITLSARCLAYGGGHRARVATTLCELLRATHTGAAAAAIGSDGGGGASTTTTTLSEPLREMIQRLVLEDERVRVRITDVVAIDETAAPLAKSSAIGFANAMMTTTSGGDLGGGEDPSALEGGGANDHFLLVHFLCESKNAIFTR